MNRFQSTLRASLLIAVTLVFASMAHAQAARTWVSGVGDDVNPCSRTAPCKTFAGAISKTITGGEISVLDPGGFGTIIISKSITIDGTGTLASILSSGTTGIIINIIDAKDAAKSVRIRGLSINGAGTGVNGIRVVAANKVSIEDTVINGHVTNGIYVEARTGQVFVKNATISNNSGVGINVVIGGQAAISDVNLIYNGTGLAGPIFKFNNIVLYGNKSGDPPLL